MTWGKPGDVDTIENGDSWHVSIHGGDWHKGWSILK